MHTNFLEKVTVKFDNTKPVEVMDFLTSIDAFRKEYESVVKAEGFKIDDNDMKLYIHVKEGCIQWEFIRQIWNSEPVQATLAFVGSKVLEKTWGKIESIFSRVQKEQDISNNSIAELDNARGVLQPAKNDLASRLSVKYENPREKIEITFETHGAVSRGVYDKITEVINAKRLPVNDEFQDKILQLSVSNKKNSTAIRGIITDFDVEKDYQIAFSDDIKNAITQQEKPFEEYYLVSGNIKKAPNGKIVLYYITKIEKIET